MRHPRGEEYPSWRELVRSLENDTERLVPNWRLGETPVARREESSVTAAVTHLPIRLSEQGKRPWLSQRSGSGQTMRTYTHGVIGYLLYAKRSRQEQRLAMMGSILPDGLLAIGFIPHYLEDMTNSPMVASLHHLLHHSDLHIVTVGMHSFMIVGPLLVLAYFVYKPALPFLVGMLAHGIVDLLTHAQWAYNHFYPIRLEPISGIFSYTDVGFMIVEHAFLLLVVGGWIIKRHEQGSQTSD